MDNNSTVNTMQNEAKSYVFGIVLFLVGLMFFGFFDAASKHLLETYPAPFLNVMRYGTVCIVAIFLWLRAPAANKVLEPKYRKLLIARGIALGLVGTCFMTALIWMPLAEASAIYFTSPLIVVALSPWFLKESVSRPKWLAVLVGFFGMLMIVRPGNNLPLLGTALMVVAALSFATFQLLTKRLSANVSNTMQYGTTAIICLIITGLPAPFFLPSPWPTVTEFILITAVSASNALAQLILLIAFRRVQASTLAPLNYFQLLIAIVISTTWFKQPPDALALAGMGLITMAGLYLIRRNS